MGGKVVLNRTIFKVLNRTVSNMVVYYTSACRKELTGNEAFLLGTSVYRTL